MQKRARSHQAKDQRRQAFLNAALDEFFERGFSAARMADIARRAGFAKGTLYLYFENKEALFTALIETIALPNIQYIEATLADSNSVADAIRGLMQFAPLMIEESRLPQIAKVLIGDAGAFPQVVLQYRQKVIDRGLAAIAGLLERGHASGELVVRDPHLTARLVIAPVILSAVWKVVFETDKASHVDVAALLELHASLLLKALKPQEESSCA